MKLKCRIIGLRRKGAIALSAALLFGFCGLAAGAFTLARETCEIFGLASVPAPTVQTPLYPLQTAPPYTVVLDAGHGNFDTGANGVIKELELCDKTVQELYTILLADKNFNAVLTRQPKEDPKISERAAVANESKASLFLSIHGNSDSSSRSHGFECFPTPPGRIYSEQSMKFAQRIAAEMANAGHHLRGETGIRFAYYNGKQKKIVDSTDTKIRTAKSFGVLERVNCPAVLAEQGFITNAQDVANWGGDEGCKNAAKVYYKAICAYFGLAAKQ